MMSKYTLLLSLFLLILFFCDGGAAAELPENETDIVLETELVEDVIENVPERLDFENNLTEFENEATAVLLNGLDKEIIYLDEEAYENVTEEVDISLGTSDQVSDSELVMSNDDSDIIEISTDFAPSDTSDLIINGENSSVDGENLTFTSEYIDSSDPKEISESTDPLPDDILFLVGSSDNVRKIDNDNLVITPGYPEMVDTHQVPLYSSDSASDDDPIFPDEYISIMSENLIQEDTINTIWESDEISAVPKENVLTEQPETMYSSLEGLSVSSGYPDIMEKETKPEINTEKVLLKDQLRNTLITAYSRTHEAPSMYFTELISAIIILLTSGALTALYVFRPDIIDPESRPGKILTAIRGHQGITITELQTITGYSRNSVSYNIHRLESYHRISKVNRNGTNYYYLGTIPANINEAQMQHIISRKNPHTIFRTIMEHPGITQKELIEVTGIPQTTCQWHLSCLVRERAVKTEKEKNFISYTILPEYIWLYTYLTKDHDPSAKDTRDDNHPSGTDGA